MPALNNAPLRSTYAPGASKDTAAELALDILGGTLRAVAEDALRPETREERQLRERLEREERERQQREEQERRDAAAQLSEIRETSSEVQNARISAGSAPAIEEELKLLKAQLDTVLAKEASSETQAGKSAEELNVLATGKSVLQLLQSAETDMQIAMGVRPTFALRADVTVVPFDESKPLRLTAIPAEFSFLDLGDGRIQLKEQVSVTLGNAALVDPVDPEHVFRFSDVPAILTPGTVLSLSIRKNQARPYSPDTAVA